VNGENLDPGAICVTGMGWTTPLGDTLDGVWDALLAGEHGLRDLPSPHRLRTTLAATVDTLPATRPPYERQIDLTVDTLRSAYASARLDPHSPLVRLVLGTSYGPNLDQPARALDDWAVAATHRLGHPHRPVSVSTACSAGADAILVAAELIRAGDTDICVAGGADVVTAAKRLGHSVLGTMSRDRLRAFDERHDGMVPGEGAAFLVLESTESARRRGVDPLAVLRGAGSANDASGLTAPDPSGDSVVLAIERSLHAGRRTSGQVAIVSAHATGTPLNDEVENVSLRRVFATRGHRPVVFATKGALGHSLGATGAIEAVSVVLALRHGKVPPVYGLDTPMAGTALPIATGGPVAFEGRLGASVTLGFGGFHTCLLFERVGP
jgi:3-oxoacyl-[acyl-carrier-protein] synthase II